MTHRILAIDRLLAAALVVAAGVACRGALSAPSRDAPGPAASRQAAAAARAFADAGRAEVRFPGGRVIAATVADTPERIMYGYMFHPEVREDEGMVFLFRPPGVHRFWMKNTLVPLDIIWMDEDRVILHIEAAAPPCRMEPCPAYGPMRAASMVLEVAAGTAARERLATGARLAIVLPGEPAAPR